MIEVAGLRVVFGRTLALDGLDLQIEPGITGLFGPNGSGKSTLLRAIAGLQRPTSGNVSIDGESPVEASESLRRRIGYAGHDMGMYPRLTVRENLELFATLYGATAARVDVILESLDLHSRSSTPANELSAGLGRRAAVARALVHDPEVLLLDEPYANLDDESSELLGEAIVGWAQPGRTALVATHGGKRVKAYASAGIIIKNGRVVVAGNYQRPRAVDSTT